MVARSTLDAKVVGSNPTRTAEKKDGKMKKKLERTDFPEGSMVLWVNQVSDQKYWKNPKIFIFKEKYGERHF